MKTLKWFILASSMIALISCSNIDGPVIDITQNDSPVLDNGTSDTRNNTNTNQNDSTGGGKDTNIVDWIDGGTEYITLTPS